MAYVDLFRRYAAFLYGNVDDGEQVFPDERVVDRQRIARFCRDAGAGAEDLQVVFGHDAAVKGVHRAETGLDASGFDIRSVNALPDLPKLVGADRRGICRVKALRIGKFGEETGAGHDAYAGALL